MSREERRAYQRMMKGSDREPRLPPAAQARRERARARRSERAGGGSSRRFWFWTILLAAFAGLVAFSVQWPAMPNALYVGIIASGSVLILLAGLRFLLRRSAPR